MRTCPACGADCDGEADCPACGAPLPASEATSAGHDEPAAAGETPLGAAAVGDPDADAQATQRERFERRYGIDIGDRTVEEYLAYLNRQDYDTTPWYWAVVVTEVVGVSLFVASLRWDVPFGGDALVFAVPSVALALAILADSRAVGQFGRWTKIRWTYVLSAALPLIGHLTGLFYLLLRRFMQEETVEHRRRLLNAGVDLDADGDD